MNTAPVRSSLMILAALGVAACGGSADSNGVSAEQMRVEAADQAASECSANPNKVFVCHIPPGNPDNWHTICVSENAVATHMSHHGDTIGTCEAVEEDPGMPEGDDDDDGGGDGTDPVPPTGGNDADD